MSSDFCQIKNQTVWSRVHIFVRKDDIRRHDISKKTANQIAMRSTLSFLRQPSLPLEETSGRTFRHRADDVDCQGVNHRNHPMGLEPNHPFISVARIAAKANLTLPRELEFNTLVNLYHGVVRENRVDLFTSLESTGAYRLFAQLSFFDQRLLEADLTGDQILDIFTTLGKQEKERFIGMLSWSGITKMYKAMPGGEKFDFHLAFPWQAARSALLAKLS